MTNSGLSITPAPGGEPWFRVRPRAAMAVAALLFVGVFVLRFIVTNVADAVAMLYTLPIALVALAFGRRAGIMSGVLAVALAATWVVVTDVDITPIGWMSRAVPLLLLGGLIGDASDRLVVADQHRRALEAAAQRHRDAAEVNDTLVQGMAAAKWALEAGRHESGLRTLEETIEQGHQLVSKLLRDADMGLDGHRGAHMNGSVQTPG